MEAPAYLYDDKDFVDVDRSVREEDDAPNVDNDSVGHQSDLFDGMYHIHRCI